MIKQFTNWCESHILLLSLILFGLILTIKAIEYTNTQRGYVAFGGEYLILPLLLLLYFAIKDEV